MDKPIPTTLIFLRDGSRILLGYKKRGFGEGLWNGIGGKKEPGESFEQSAIRESKEEISAIPQKLSLVGIFTFNFAPTSYLSGKDQVAYVFFCNKWKGEINESDEIKPKWFNETEIPFDTMWSYHRISMPIILGGTLIRADFSFDDEIQVKSFNITKLKL